MKNSLGALVLLSGCLAGDANSRAQQDLNDVSTAAVNKCGAQLAGRPESVRLDASFNNIDGLQAGFQQNVARSGEEPLDEDCLLAAVSKVDGVVNIRGDRCVVQGYLKPPTEEALGALRVDVDCVDHEASAAR